MKLKELKDKISQEKYETIRGLVFLRDGVVDNNVEITEDLIKRIVTVRNCSTFEQQAATYNTAVDSIAAGANRNRGAVPMKNINMSQNPAADLIVAGGNHARESKSLKSSVNNTAVDLIVAGANRNIQ